MFFSILACIALIGAIISLVNWLGSGAKDFSYLMALMGCILTCIAFFKISAMDSVIKLNEKELEELKKRLPPKAEAEENNDTKKDGE